MNKTVILDFIADLVCPIDPAVFVGAGTNYQNEYSNGMASEDPTICLTLEERYISDFINSNNLFELLSLVVDILLNKPIDYSNGLPIRREDDWDYYVNLVISKIGNKIPDETAELLNFVIIKDKNMQKNIIEILSFMDFENSSKILKMIKSNFENLSDEF